MQIQVTVMQPLSEAESFVDIVLADSENEEEAETHIRCRCTVDHEANPLVAEVQQAALRHAREMIDDQIQLLGKLIKARP